MTPLRALTPPEADRLDRDLGLLVPNIRITELLNEVAQATGFARCFTDLRDGRPVDDVTTVLAAVLADATNLGIERMADGSVANPERGTRKDEVLVESSCGEQIELLRE